MDYAFLKYLLGSTLTHQTGQRVPQPTLPEQGKQKHRANTTSPPRPCPIASAHTTMTSAALTRVETNFFDGLVLAGIYLTGRLH